MKSTIPPGGFFGDPDFDFQARIALGSAATGVGDVGLVLAVLDRITDGDRQSWFDAWFAAGKAMEQQATEARLAGRRGTAEWGLLTAADFYAHAQDAADGLPDPAVGLAAFTDHRRCWEAMIDAAEGRHQRVAVPYEDTQLPGFLLRPDDSGHSRPTLVLTNGSDGALSTLVGCGAAEALARGWNAFLYDGPGQQSMLFDHGVPFRPDWEAVLTPVVDTLVERPDVDADALTAYGISQAGFWLPRALAFEQRFVAAVADPGVVDVSTSWNAYLPDVLLDLLRAGHRETFDGYLSQLGSDPAAARTFAFRARPYGITDPYDLYTELARYHLRDVAGRIRTPLLINDPVDEQFWPGQSQELSTLLAGDRELASFTREQGANMHCQPLGRALTNRVMIDWLSDRLARRTA